MLTIALLLAWSLEPTPGAEGPRLAENLRALASVLPGAGPVGATPTAQQEHADRSAALVLTINPEGRVKATRGPAAARLNAGVAAPLLVKIVNHSGGQPRLQVRHDYPGAAKSPFAFAFRTEAGGAELSGTLVEYRLLAATCAAAGRHEATLAFDAGQGTQDLGFRGEAPILFTVAPATRR